MPHGYLSPIASENTPPTPIGDRKSLRCFIPRVIRSLVGPPSATQRTPFPRGTTPTAEPQQLGSLFFRAAG